MRLLHGPRLKFKEDPIPSSVNGGMNMARAPLPSPELLGGQPCAFGHGLELGPNNLGMTYSRAKTAVRTRDYVFATH